MENKLIKLAVAITIGGVVAKTVRLVKDKKNLVEEVEVVEHESNERA